jgi:hypothetical protein
LKPAKSDEVSALLIVVLAFRYRGNAVNETPPEKGINRLSLLLKLSPLLISFPTLSIPLLYTPKCPPSLVPSAPSLPGSLPRSLLLPPARLRLLSVSRGEPGASPRALSVSTMNSRVLLNAVQGDTQDTWTALKHHNPSTMLSGAQ